MREALKKLRAAYIDSVVTTKERFENFRYWSAEAKRLKAIYLATPTNANRRAYLRAKSLRSIRLRTFRKSRIGRAELKARYTAAKKMLNQPLRLRALAKAYEYVGVMERGGNNRGEDVERIIQIGGGVAGQAWCGWFVGAMYKLVGSKAITWQVGAVRLMSLIPGVGVTHFPRAGYAVRYTFDHTGIFHHFCDANGKKVSRRRATHIKAVEGNTGASGAVSDSTTGGDGVYVKIRPLSQVRDYINIPR